MLRQSLRLSFYKGSKKIRFSDDLYRHKHGTDGKALYLNQSQQYIRRDGERWWIVDCAGEELQQVAKVNAAYLLGMNRPDFRPGTIAGDHVINVNTKDVVMVGDQWIRTPLRFTATNWPAGRFNVRMSEVFDKDPSMVVWYWTQKLVNEYFVGKRHVMEAPMEKLWLYEDAIHPHWDMSPKSIQWTSDKKATPYMPYNARQRWRYSYHMK